MRADGPSSISQGESQWSVAARAAPKSGTSHGLMGSSVKAALNRDNMTRAKTAALNGRMFAEHCWSRPNAAFDLFLRVDLYSHIPLRE